MGDIATDAGLHHLAHRPGLPRLIAVDGSAASGKSTVGQRLAARLGYPFLDTGTMYRAITVAAVKRGIPATDAPALSRLASLVDMQVGLAEPGSGETATISVDGEDVTAELRRPDVEEAVSLVSRVAGVRDALVALQRRIAASRPIVMAGRDIGTVVLPDADLKVYLDASLNERAARRHREFGTLGREVTQAAVLQDLRRRDQIDKKRTASPLRPAPDAVIIETDSLTLDEVMSRVMRLVEEQA
ncbi:MAG: (d)CMP kinase [Chloroflexi bacterium]|nr:MAG: (d)CMP kinase [Chloroflexota bacterium]